MCLAGFVLYPCERHYPVCFPSLAAIIRERLFKAGEVWGDVRKAIPNKDGSAIKWFVIEKLAAAILELADHGLTHGTVSAAGPIEAPLVGLGIVKTQAHTFDVTCKAIGFELEQTGSAIPDFADNGHTLIFVPGSGAC